MEDKVKGIRKITNAFLAFALISSVSVGIAYAEDQKPATETPAAAAAAPAPAAAPAEDKVTGSVALGGLNRYIFRGYELSSHSAVLEPSVTVSYKGFSLNVWGNIDSSEHQTQSFPTKALDRIGKTTFDETDLTLSYTYNIDKLALTGGFIYYGTQYADETQELFVSGSYDMIAHPTLAVYRDIDRYPGTYINLSLSQSIPVYKLANGDVTLDLGAGFGYEAGSSNYWNTYVANKGNTGSKYSAFHDGNVKAGFTIPVTKLFSVQPIVQYWFPLSGDASKTVRDSSGINQFNPNGHLDQTFVYGLNAILTF